MRECRYLARTKLKCAAQLLNHRHSATQLLSVKAADYLNIIYESRKECRFARRNKRRIPHPRLLTRDHYQYMVFPRNLRDMSERWCIGLTTDWLQAISLRHTRFRYGSRHFAVRFVARSGRTYSEFMIDYVAVTRVGMSLESLGKETRCNNSPRLMSCVERIYQF